MAFGGAMHTCIRTVERASTKGKGAWGALVCVCMCVCVVCVVCVGGGLVDVGSRCLSQSPNSEPLMFGGASPGLCVPPVLHTHCPVQRAASSL